MNFNIQTRGVSLGNELQNYFRDIVSRRIGKVVDMENSQVLVMAEASKTKEGRRGEDLYRAELSITINGRNFYSSEEASTMRKAMDKVSKEVFAIIDKSQDRQIELRRKGGSKIKKILKKHD